MGALTPIPNRKVVVSQSMYFPWVGLLEQVNLCDVFVHYDDVQFARGFLNRVQIKTSHGSRWLTIPTTGKKRHHLINQVCIDDTVDWRTQHRNSLKSAYRGAPYYNDMCELVDRVFSIRSKWLRDITRESIIALSEFFDISARYEDSQELGIGGSSSQRLHDIVLGMEGSIYITGHGAANYLDHELFTQSGIEVEYMDYQYNQYPQLHGEYTPYISALDLVANCGADGRQHITSQTVHHKEFTKRSQTREQGVE